MVNPNYLRPLEARLLRAPLGGADLDASLHAGDTFNGRHEEIGHLTNVFWDASEGG